jgi:hypothetical protein
VNGPTDTEPVKQIRYLASASGWLEEEALLAGGGEPWHRAWPPVRGHRRPSLDTYDVAGERAMKNLRIDWPVFLECVLGSIILVMVGLIPMLAGAPLGHWALAAALGLVIGLFIYVRVDLRRRSGKDASENSEENLD